MKGRRTSIIVTANILVLLVAALLIWGGKVPALLNAPAEAPEESAENPGGPADQAAEKLASEREELKKELSKSLRESIEGSMPRPQAANSYFAVDKKMIVLEDVYSGEVVPCSFTMINNTAQRRTVKIRPSGLSIQIKEPKMVVDAREKAVVRGTLDTTGHTDHFSRVISVYAGGGLSTTVRVHCSPRPAYKMSNHSIVLKPAPGTSWLTGELIVEPVDAEVGGIVDAVPEDDKTKVTLEQLGQRKTRISIRAPADGLPIRYDSVITCKTDSARIPEIKIPFIVMYGLVSSPSGIKFTFQKGKWVNEKGLVGITDYDNNPFQVIKIASHPKWLDVSFKKKGIAYYELELVVNDNADQESGNGQILVNTSSPVSPQLKINASYRRRPR